MKSLKSLKLHKQNHSYYVQDANTSLKAETHQHHTLFYLFACVKLTCFSFLAAYLLCWNGGVCVRAAMTVHVRLEISVSFQQGLYI